MPEIPDKDSPEIMSVITYIKHLILGSTETRWANEEIWWLYYSCGSGILLSYKKIIFSSVVVAYLILDRLQIYNALLHTIDMRLNFCTDSPNSI